MRAAWTATRTRREARIASAVALGAFLVAQAGAFAHEAFVPHLTCAEHGERIHAGAGNQAGAPHRPPSSRSQALAAGDSGEDGHEHCGLVLHRRERGAPAIFRVATSWLGPQPAAVAFIDAVFLPVESDRYLVAPKNSPPA